MNRDPIEEKGGLNLYAFCTNNGVNKYDYLGQDGINPVAQAAVDNLIWAQWVGPWGGAKPFGQMMAEAADFAANHAGYRSDIDARLDQEAAASAAAAKLSAKPVNFDIPNVTNVGSGHLADDSIIANGGDLTVSTLTLSKAPKSPAFVANAGSSSNSDSDLLLGIAIKSNIPFSSASLQYTPSTNSVSGSVSATTTSGSSFLIGPTVTYKGPISGPTVFTLGGSVTISPPFAVSVNAPFTTEEFFGIELPMPTSITAQVGVGGGISGTLNTPRTTINLLSVNQNFDTGKQDSGGVLAPLLKKVSKGGNSGGR